MPAPNASFTIKSNAGLKRILITKVIIHPLGRQEHFTINAIWDTGATSSAITSRVVNQLGLIPTGLANVTTANGPALQKTYTIDIGLPNRVLIQGIVANELDSLTSGCDALIGMDIITLGDFSVTNYNGVTCMSFRWPSCHEIDYVKNPNLGTTSLKNNSHSKPGSNYTPPKKKRRR